LLGKPAASSQFVVALLLSVRGSKSKRNVCYSLYNFYDTKPTKSTELFLRYLYYTVQVKVTFTLEQNMKAQKGVEL
jgi:hypothetical protein